MRSIRRYLQYLSLGVLAVVVNACERPTAPNDSPRLPVGDAPNAAISDAANTGTFGFYFLPPLVSDPGPFLGQFDGSIEPYVTVCPMPTDCGDLGPTMTLPFGGAKPSGISVDLLSESYNANWNKPALDFGKHRLRVHASVFVAGFTRQVTLGFVDLQVVAKKKEPVDAGFIPVVKGSPIPVKFRIETRTIGGLIWLSRNEIVVGTFGRFGPVIFDLKGRTLACLAAEMTWTSADPNVATVDAQGTVHGISVGDVTITATCRGTSGSYTLHVVSGPV